MISTDVQESSLNVFEHLSRLDVKALAIDSTMHVLLVAEKIS